MKSLPFKCFKCTARPRWTWSSRAGAILPILLTLSLHAGPAGGDRNFMPLDQVKPGMKGVGKTVFRGAEVEEFEAEVLGVLKNITPRQDAILARLSGGPLEKTGVMGGMSGSPVYVDGRLIGAVAFSFPFSKEAVAGLTPIEQMVGIFEQSNEPVRGDPIVVEVSSIAPHRTLGIRGPGILPVPNSRTAPVFTVSKSMAAGAASLKPLSGQLFRYIDTPLVLSGVAAEAADLLGGALGAYGMRVLQGGGSGSGAAGAELADGSDVVPGSSIAVQLMRGDLGFGASASGTVTHREGDRIYAFGHPWFSLGPVDLPVSKARVISLLPNLNNSFKIAVPTDLVGSITQDRSRGLYGTIGQAPKLIPLVVNLRSSRNTSRTFRFELVNDRLLTPFLANFTIFSTIISQERALGESTLQVQGKISLKDRPDVRIENLFSGEANSQLFASLAVGQPLSYILGSGFEGVDIQEIAVDITSIDEKRTGRLDRIWSNRESVRPGETVILSAVLRTPKGEEIVEKIPLPVPEDISGGSLLVTVADGSTLTATENQLVRRNFVPRDLDQLIRAINNLRKNDRVYVRLQRPEPAVMLHGEEFSSLPPSFRQVLTSARSSSSSLTLIGASNLYEYELPSMSFVIQGRRTLTLKVVD